MSKHPTWDRVFDHIGREVGTHYLKEWAARLVYKPNTRLPVLALHGGLGKSVFARSMSLLADKTVLWEEVDNPFNGRMKDARLCILEGNQYKADYFKVLRYSDELLVNQKGKEVVKVKNKLNFIVCMPSDRDVIREATMIKVHNLESIIKPIDLFRALEHEKPFFLATLKEVNVSGKLEAR